jgi:hypothetical protein
MNGRLAPQAAIGRFFYSAESPQRYLRQHEVDVLLRHLLFGQNNLAFG